MELLAETKFVLTPDLEIASENCVTADKWNTQRN
jgi:hypothetical protein